MYASLTTPRETPRSAASTREAGRRSPSTKPAQPDRRAQLVLDLALQRAVPARHAHEQLQRAGLVFRHRSGPYTRARRGRTVQRHANQRMDRRWTGRRPRRRVVPRQRGAGRLPVQRRAGDPVPGRRADPDGAAQGPARAADGPKEFALLFGVAAVGMVIFNLAVLGTVERIGATNAGVVIGASPVRPRAALPAARQAQPEPPVRHRRAGRRRRRRARQRHRRPPQHDRPHARPDRAGGRGRLHAAGRAAAPAPGPDARRRLVGVDRQRAAARSSARATSRPRRPNTQPRSPTSR